MAGGDDFAARPARLDAEARAALEVRRPELEHMQAEARALLAANRPAPVPDALLPPPGERPRPAEALATLERSLATMRDALGVALHAAPDLADALRRLREQ